MSDIARRNEALMELAGQANAALESPANPPGSAAVITKAVDDLDKVSRRLSRAGGMAIAAGLTDLVDIIGEAGCDLDTVINDLQELADDDS